MTINEISEEKPSRQQLTDDAEDDVDGHHVRVVDPDFDRQRVERQPNESDDTEGHIRPR